MACCSRSCYSVWEGGVRRVRGRGESYEWAFLPNQFCLAGWGNKSSFTATQMDGTTYCILYVCLLMVHRHRPRAEPGQASLLRHRVESMPT